jgi:hypothetical protein
MFDRTLSLVYLDLHANSLVYLDYLRCSDYIL